MTDLIERLRGVISLGSQSIVDVCEEAANALEAVWADLRKTEANLNDADKEEIRLLQRIEELEVDLKDYATAIGQNDKLRKENERLRAVVEDIAAQELSSGGQLRQIARKALTAREEAG